MDWGKVKSKMQSWVRVPGSWRSHSSYSKNNTYLRVSCSTPQGYTLWWGLHTTTGSNLRHDYFTTSSFSSGPGKKIVSGTSQTQEDRSKNNLFFNSKWEILMEEISLCLNGSKEWRTALSDIWKPKFFKVHFKIFWFVLFVILLKSRYQLSLSSF